MNESLIVELWDLIREYSDKKQLSVIAEKYIELISDHGARDNDIRDALGHDDSLDEAIKIVLAIEDEDNNYEDD
jgi:hypothetical protein